MLSRHENIPSRAAEIKRLLAHGQYRIDPREVAEAMIRRGNWELQGRRPPFVLAPAPVTLRKEPS